jgi:hypothetical protein
VSVPGGFLLVETRKAQEVSTILACVDGDVRIIGYYVPKGAYIQMG